MFAKYKKLKNFVWPKVKKEFLETEEKEIVIQINGKKKRQYNNK